MRAQRMIAVAPVMLLLLLTLASCSGGGGGGSPMASSGSAPPFTPTADTGGSTPTLGATSSSSQTVNPVAPVPADITRVPESGTLLLLGLGLVGLAGVARKLKK